MDFTECYGDTVSSVAAAARSGCRKRVRRLIKRGFSADCRDNRGWNALHEAAAAGSQGCVQEILSAIGKKRLTYDSVCVSDDKPHNLVGLQLITNYFLDYAISRLVFKMSENTEKCWSLISQSLED